MQPRSHRHQNKNHLYATVQLNEDKDSKHRHSDARTHGQFNARRPTEQNALARVCPPTPKRRPWPELANAHESAIAFGRLDSHDLRTHARALTHAHKKRAQKRARLYVSAQPSARTRWRCHAQAWSLARAARARVAGLHGMLARLLWRRHRQWTSL
eukprot:5530640-Pleurochrysis_carterae.AAC.1